MNEASTEALFVRYRETGDAQALGVVFDRLAPQLLLIAGHLGGAAAEDLVQATFLDAIRHGDRWDASRPLAPWLVGLLGNHLREARRLRQRVLDADRLEPSRDERPDDAAAANECLAAVHTAVERLPRHYRQVLSLRLVHGLELQAIAHSLDLPLGTVKVRVHRGMAMLRRALPAGLATSLAVMLSTGRGLAAVRQVVLGNGVAVGGAAVGGGVAVGGSLAVGVLFGSLLMKKVAIVVLLLAAAGTWWAFDAINRSGAAVGAVPPANAVVVAVSAIATDAVPAPSVPAPTAARADTGIVRESVPTTGTLLVEVVWASDGAPAPGLEVQALGRDRSARTKGHADATGKLEFAALVAGSYRLTTTRGGMTKAVPADVVAGETRSCKVTVTGDVRLQVAVVDDAGLPQPDVAVWRENPDGGDGDPLGLGSTDAAGRLAYRGLCPGSVWAQKAGRQPSLVHDLPRLRQGEPPPAAIDVQLVLGPAGCSLLGTVVDPQGRVVADAKVQVACDDSISLGPRHRALTMTTDVAGRFRCDEVPAGERYLVADAPGFAPTYARMTTSNEQPVTIVIALRVGATLSGRVTDAERQPLANVEVTAIRRQYLPGLDLSWSSRSTRTDADGRYRLEAILPDEMEAAVAIEPRAVRQFPFHDGEQQTWDVVKEPDRSIRGIVVDADDKPLAHWMVRSMGRASTRNMNPPLTQTDAQGGFRLTGLEDDSYRLFVMAPVNGSEAAMSAAAMVPRAVVENVHPSADALTIRLDAAAMASGWIEGSIAMPEGLQAKTELSLYAKALRGGGFAVPQERLAAGETKFRIGPLPAGEYDLLCDVDGRGRLSQNALRLGLGETLRLPPFAADAQRPLVVELRHADGQLAIGATVKLRQTLDPCPEIAPGRYASRPVAAGSYDVVARGPDFALASFAVEFAGQQAPFVHTVAPATAVQLCLRPVVARERWVGALSMTLTDGNGAPLVKELIQIDGKQDFVVPIGLLPGSYTFACSCFGDGHASTTFTVGSAPQRVDVQLVK